MNKIFAAFLLVMVCFVSDASTGKKRIELDETTSKELLTIIKNSDTLHKYMYDRKDPMVSSQITILKTSIDTAIKNVKGQQSQHISRILNTINKQLTSAQMTRGDDRTKYLQSAFKQLVILYQSYKIEAPYKVFFCKNNRAVWIQEEPRKAENPFEVSSNCGRKVF